MKNKVDRDWIKIREEAFKLNPEANEFWRALNFEEYKIAKTWYDSFGQNDPAHIFGKGAYLHMKYMIENIIIIPRYCHSHIDQSRNPFTLQYMSEEEKRLFWIKFIGIERYNFLEKESRK